MILADDRVASVLKRDEGLLEVFTSVSPAFEALRKPALRRTMARMVTVAQAAKIAKVDVEFLLRRLNEAYEGGEGGQAPRAVDATPAEDVEPTVVPQRLLELPEERLLDLDVRRDLREGREPLRRILDAVRSLSEGQVLRLRAIFEPEPLYGVLGKQGFAHFTERIADDDWRIWFYRGEAMAKASSEGKNTAKEEVLPTADEDIIVLDVREFEPPEPMVQTLEALSALPKGKTLLQINQRVPQFLLPKLDERGFTYEIREQSESLVRIFIRHKES